MLSLNHSNIDLMTICDKIALMKIFAPIHKSFVTHALAVLLILVGYAWCPSHILPIGLYALSGAITNWLAVYMLFEKIPFLYGSGIVPTRFEDFKRGIRTMMMNEFFSKPNIARFFNAHQLQKVNFEPLIIQVDYDQLFDGLVEVILSSSFGTMIQLLGGREKLEPLKNPVKAKMKEIIRDLLKNPSFTKAAVEQIPLLDPAVINQKVTQMVDERLDELTPTMVKKIVQDMIAEHLGWLVVWGGVFGGLIGFATSFIPSS